MSNIIFGPEYKVLPCLLVERRKSAGLSQRAVAVRMRRAQSFVQKMETGQKRIELIEFCRFIRAVDADPYDAFEELMLRQDLSAGGAGGGAQTILQLEEIAA